MAKFIPDFEQRFPYDERNAKLALTSELIH